MKRFIQIFWPYVASIASIAVVTGVIFILLGCSPRVAERVVVNTDTCYIGKTRTDSIYLKDSVYIREWLQGDTVRVETTRLRDRWHERIVRDTVYKASHDTIRVVEVREVDKRLSWWQRLRQGIGTATLLAIAALMGYRVYRAARMIH